MRIEFITVREFSELDGRSKISRVNLVLRAGNIKEKRQLGSLAERAHEAQLVAISDGKAGTGNAVGTSSSSIGVDSMIIEVHLGGSNLSEARNRIRGLLGEAIRLNDIDE